MIMYLPQSCINRLHDLLIHVHALHTEKYMYTVFNTLWYNFKLQVKSSYTRCVYVPLICCLLQVQQVSNVFNQLVVCKY